MRSIEHLYIHELKLKRKTVTRDSQGGVVETWQEVKTFKGRIRPASISERELAAKEEATISHVVYCDPSVGITRGDIVVYGDLESEIIGVSNPSYLSHHLECQGIAVQHG